MWKRKKKKRCSSDAEIDLLFRIPKKKLKGQFSRRRRPRGFLISSHFYRNFRQRWRRRGDGEREGGKEGESEREKKENQSGFLFQFGACELSQVYRVPVLYFLTVKLI